MSPNGFFEDPQPNPSPQFGVIRILALGLNFGAKQFQWIGDLDYWNCKTITWGLTVFDWGGDFIIKKGNRWDLVVFGLVGLLGGFGFGL